MSYDWSRLTTTAESSQNRGVKVLVYGPPGAGKTRLVATATPDDPTKTLLISAESGTLSLAGHDIPEAPIESWEQFQSIYNDIKSAVDSGAFPYEWIAIDSISEIVEQCLEVKTAAHAGDTWAIYREMKNDVIDMLKKFRDLPGINVYFSSEQEREKTEQGLLLYQPQVPGKAVAAKLPYLFDEVFAYRVERDVNGNVSRWLQTQGDHQYYAKDRSGKLDPGELPDLAAIRRKMLGQ